MEQLLAFGFGAGADFQGLLVGALERVESGGAVRILDVLFVRRDEATGELEALSMRGDGAGGIAAPAIGFRLDPAERRRQTERALRNETLRELAETLEPGAAIAAVLLRHRWAEALHDAVDRTGGTPLANRFLEASELAEVAPELAARSRDR